MSESFLHYIWQFQYFNRSDLKTTDGETVHVLHPGMLNTHAGPDFFNTRIKIGQMEWVGSAEIHINSSGWMDHNHDSDAAYENVVLHVVWKNDKPVRRKDGSFIPTLELKSRISDQLLLDYKQLVNSPEDIPCSGTFHTVPGIIKTSMLDKALLRRLEMKAVSINEMFTRNNQDWEETCYQLLAKNFGFKVNADPFLQLARSIPYKVLLKHADKSLQVESVLFGQAGFLDDKAGDDYHKLLQREHAFLSTKYNLAEKKLHKSQWRFLRLRPSNFPTIRLAQLSTLIHNQKNIFSRILEASTYPELKKIFNVRQSEYWLHHYKLSVRHEDAIPGIGDMSIDNILINTVAPLLVAYGRSKDEQEWIDRAVAILQQVPAEDNAITRRWLSLGQGVTTAFESQALIELYNNLCQKKRCLDCNIGASILKPGPV